MLASVSTPASAMASSAAEYADLLLIDEADG